VKCKYALGSSANVFGFVILIAVITLDYAIELARRGVHDAPTLTEMTLKELKHYLPYA